MLTDELPTTWHSDQYLREWAVDRGLDRYPKALVPLISASQAAPDIAEISFWDRGWPVRRFNQRLQFKPEGDTK